VLVRDGLSSNSTSTNARKDAVPQLFTLDKRSLFSHIHGEIAVKIYRTSSSDVALRPQVQQAAGQAAVAAGEGGDCRFRGGGCSHYDGRREASRTQE
jgi:hypothetical protein